MSQSDNRILQELKAIAAQLQNTNERMNRLEINLNQIAEITKALATTGNKNTLQLEKSMQQLFHPVHTSISKLKSVNNLIARSLPRAGKKVFRVVFMVHNVETWDALHDIYQLMMEHERFEPVVISMKRDFLNAQRYGQEEVNFKGLQSYGIDPIRFNSENHGEELEMLKLMSPDLIFRQSPWDISVPSSFHFFEIDFAKICYVSYGFGSVALQAQHTNHYFMRSCWRAYCETQKHADSWRHVVFDSNLAVAGSPKFDRIQNTKDTASWPIPDEDGSVRIIWAPHHSLTADWLYFSTFPNNYKQFLQLARECPNLQIVLKPHPTLFEKLVAYGILTPEETRNYLEEFLALPNTALMTGANYLSLFWGSDLMITDGIGFFGEYMMTEKPIIWTENPGHFPLNEVGEMLQEGMYRAHDFEDVVRYLEQLCVEKEDPLQSKRKEIIGQLRPRPEGSAQFIVNDVLQGLENE